MKNLYRFLKEHPNFDLNVYRSANSQYEDDRLPLRIALYAFRNAYTSKEISDDKSKEKMQQATAIIRMLVEHGACTNIDVDVSNFLDQHFDICTRSGLHCAPLKHKHLGTQISGAVRVSMSYFNTYQEIERLVFAVKHMLKTQKKTLF